MKRKIFAVVLGVIAAVVLIIAIEALGHSLYPLPAGIDVTDTEAMKAYVMTLPVAALLIVMAAWIVATLVGGLIACFIARETPLIYSAIIGGLVLRKRALLFCGALTFAEYAKPERRFSENPKE